jgi:hypothetical protein
MQQNSQPGDPPQGNQKAVKRRNGTLTSNDKVIRMFSLHF